MTLRFRLKALLTVLALVFSSLLFVSVANSKGTAIGKVRAYPNPFNNYTENLQIDKGAGNTFTNNVKITIYDYTMKKVYEDTQTGTLSWGGYSDDGRRLGSGLYYIKLVETVSGTSTSEDGTVRSQIIKVLIK